MKKLLLITIASSVLFLATPVYADSTWIPEYQSGQTVYTSPKLSLNQIDLSKASKVEGIKFLSINTIRGDDLPQEQYAKVLNDRIVSSWSSSPDFPTNDYATLVYVRNDVNPAKGSFSINVGSKWRNNFSPASLTELQIPILKRYMPQDPSGGIVAIAEGLNHEIAIQRFANTFLLWLLGAIGFCVVVYFGCSWGISILANLEKERKRKDRLLARFNILEASYRATFEELQYLKLVEYKDESLKLFNEINEIFTALSADFERLLEQKKKSSLSDDFEKGVEMCIKNLDSLNTKKILKLKNSREVAAARFAELKTSVAKLDANHERTEDLKRLIYNIQLDDIDPLRLSSIIDSAFNEVKDINKDIAKANKLHLEVQQLFAKNKELPDLIAKEFDGIGLKHGSEKWLSRLENDFLPLALNKTVLAQIKLLQELKSDLSKYWQPYQDAIADRDSFKFIVADYKKKLSVLNVPKHLKSEQGECLNELKKLEKQPYTLTLKENSQWLLEKCNKWVKAYDKYLKTKKNVQAYSSSRVRSAEIYLDNGDYNRVDSLMSSWDSEDRSSRNSSNSSSSSWSGSSSSSSSSWSDSSSSSSWDSSSSSSDYGSSSSGSDW